MLINSANLDLAFKGFKTIFGDAYGKAPKYWDQVAMKVTSSSRDETYGWLGQFPQMREWLSGEREVKQLEAFGYTVLNRKFEATVGVNREDYADDRYGAFGTMFAEMGHTAAQHPDTLVFPLLASGFAEQCYDGQYFFDMEHAVPDEDGPVTVEGRKFRLVSNMQEGTGPAWFLLDTTRAVKPLIFQERESYEFTHVNRHDDERVFMTDRYLYGIRARVNAGFGLWQLAFGSKAPLTVENYIAARSAMMQQKGNAGRILGVSPSLLVVPTALEAAARALLKAAAIDGSTNVWAGTAELLVSPYL